jgi:hypothetical protein
MAYQLLLKFPKFVIGLLQVIQENPSKAAPALSIVLHGVFFALLPFMNLPDLSEEDLVNQRNVSVVELGPEELSRVPDFSQSFRDLPPVSTADDFDWFDDSADRLTEPDPSLSELEDDFTSPLSPPPPVRLPPIPTFDWPTLPTRPIAPTPPSPVTPIPTPTPTPSESPVTPTPPLGNEDAETNDPGNPPLDTPPAETSEQRTERLIAERLAEQQELQRLFTQTSEPAFNFPTWQEAIAQANIETPDLDTDPNSIVEVTLPYPSAACSFIQQGFLKEESVTTSVGFAVGADNTVLEEPEPKLLQSSGIPFFDEQTLEIIENPEQDWGNDTGKAQSRILQVMFEYTEDTCPSRLSPPSEENA